MEDLELAAERWARDLWERIEGDFSAPTWEHVRELYEALRPEARVALRALAESGLEAVRDLPWTEAPAPCEARFIRFVADLVDPELGDQVQEQMRYVSDAAWLCPCDECTGFASRVEAGLRRWRLS